MEALKGNEEIRDDELMGMRWVVNVKHFPEKKKVKSQAGDLEVELLEAATPTPTRRAKHCFLQVAAHHGFELKKADVSRVFLEGREQQAERYVVPVNEPAGALGITRGKPRLGGSIGPCLGPVGQCASTHGVHSLECSRKVRAAWQEQVVASNELLPNPCVSAETLKACALIGLHLLAADNEIGSRRHVEIWVFRKPDVEQSVFGKCHLW